MEGKAVNDGGALDTTGYEELRLIRAFLRLTDPGRRQKILNLVEQLAEDTEFAAAGPAFVAADASAPEPIRDFAASTE